MMLSKVGKPQLGDSMFLLQSDAVSQGRGGGSKAGSANANENVAGTSEEILCSSSPGARAAMRRARRARVDMPIAGAAFCGGRFDDPLRAAACNMRGAT